MRLTQGTFSFLPDLSDSQITSQVQYCLDRDWPIAIEYTDDPHPRNTYWEMFGLPMFDIKDASGVMLELRACRERYPEHYIRVSGYDRSPGRQTTVLSFIVQRPSHEPGFRLVREEGADRQVRYSTVAYATDAPVGERYGRTR